MAGRRGDDKNISAHKQWMDGLPEETKRSISVWDWFSGSREFLLAWKLLEAYQRFGRGRDEIPPIFQSSATCLGLALELALKARIALTGVPPPRRGPDAHSYVALFTKHLPLDAQNEIASFVRLAPDARTATPDELVDVLRQLEGTFVDFRYVHELLQEDGKAVFHESDLTNVVHAVHDSILRVRPDLRQWRGVVYDPGEGSASKILHDMTAAYRRALAVE